ncbi:hypothetical protein MVEN_01659700 [Mycena venus]|uniref:Uncharacterized protein n=1 Tax=Mycena venus TaxID=2733690 RepID=A0A8H6XNF5_9AGAR|nr:hypothetical protein MVEN_01659700 [Mycena venus]
MIVWVNEKKGSVCSPWKQDILGAPSLSRVHRPQPPGPTLAAFALQGSTYSSIFLDRFEALNLLLMDKIQNRRKVEPPAAPDPVVAAAASSAKPAAEGAPAAGGVQKKEPKNQCSRGGRVD